MSTLLLRCILSGVLLATVAGKILAFSAGTFDELSAVAGFLTRQGLSVDEQLTANEASSISFFASGCDRPLQVMTMSLSLEAAPLREAAVDPGYVRHYIYFGRIWRTADPLALRVEWIKHKALSVMRLRRNIMRRTVLLVAAPPGCDAVERIDWRRLWEPPADTSS